MLKYAGYDIVFQEIPDEVTLAISLTNCPNRCPGCHSPSAEGRHRRAAHRGGIGSAAREIPRCGHLRLPDGGRRRPGRYKTHRQVPAYAADNAGQGRLVFGPERTPRRLLHRGHRIPQARSVHRKARRPARTDDKPTALQSGSRRKLAGHHPPLPKTMIPRRFITRQQKTVTSDFTHDYTARISRARKVPGDFYILFPYIRKRCSPGHFSIFIHPNSNLFDRP